MERDRYSTAQVCLNGHPINAYADTYPQHNQQFCDKCGAGTITNCQHCNAPIRGEYLSSGSLVFSPYVPPSFCNNCGKEYPWTGAKIQAAEQLVDMIENLTEGERDKLKKSIRDIIWDTPLCLPAAFTFQNLVARAGPEMKAAIWESISDLADSKAKKIIHI